MPLCQIPFDAHKDPGEDVTRRPQGLSLMFRDHSGGPRADALPPLLTHPELAPRLYVAAPVKETETSKPLACPLSEKPFW